MYYVRIDTGDGDVVIEKDYQGILVVGQGETPEEAKNDARRFLATYLDKVETAEVIQ